MSQQVIIFDTTLRDGEQALQASLSVKEKLQIALALERMGVKQNFHCRVLLACQAMFATFATFARCALAMVSLIMYRLEISR